MKNFTKFLWMTLLVVMSSCAMESETPDGPGREPGTDKGKEVDTNISLVIPGGFSVMSTRALSDADEMEISEATVLVFDSANDKLADVIEVGTITGSGGVRNLSVKLPGGTYDIVVVANASELIESSGIAEGDLYDDVADELVATIATAIPSAAGGTLPMWGKTKDKTISTDADLAVELVRSVARVDIGVGYFNDNDTEDTADDHWSKKSGTPAATGDDIPFEITEVYVVGANNKYQIMPDAANFDTDDKAATKPSVPADAAAFTIDDKDDFKFTDISTDRTTNATYIKNGIYIPEALVATVARESRLALVIGGKYAGSGETTYYRVDFNGQGGLVDVVRNTRYRFDISQVSGKGLSSPEKAYDAVSSNMTATVIAWGEEAFENIMFYGDKFFAMSDASPILLSAVAGDEVTVGIRTNIEEFEMSHTITGNHDITINLTQNGGLTEANFFHYSLTGSDGEYELTIKTLGSNIGGSEARTETWKVNADDLLTFDLDVVQTNSATDPTPYLVTLGGSEDGALVANTTNGYAKEGDAVRVLASPNSGMVFAGWTFSGTKIVDADPATDGDQSWTATQLGYPDLTFAMPAGSITVQANYVPAEVRVGNVIWAGTNSIPNLGGTATFQPGAAIYDGANQINWHQATTGVAGSTAGVYGKTGAGVCPTGWRLPTPTEFYALMAASTNKGATSGTMTQLSGGYYTSNPGWSGTSPAKMSVVTANGTLIFPASGLSDGGSDQGSGGYYWSSVELNAYYAYCLRFNSSSVRPASGNTRTSAFSVRCVKDVAGEYSVAAVAADDAQGSVVASLDKANAGDKIKILASPASGMIFAGWTATGITLTTADQQSATLEFTMPAKDVSVTAAFLASEVTFVLADGPVTWAASNLSAAGQFAESALAYGALFQWGNKTSYAYGSTNAMAGGSTASVWPADQNPCPSGWRLPTNVELANLINLTSATVAAVGVASGTYSTIVSNLAGGVGGVKITPKSGDTSKAIILNAAGYRLGAESLKQNTMGAFWSSVEDSSNKARAWSMSSPNLPSLTNGNTKALAISVRCVRATSVGAYNIAASAEEGGSAVASINKANAGEAVKFLASPASGMIFAGWTLTGTAIVDGDPATAGNQALTVNQMGNPTLTLAMPAGDIAAKAQFLPAEVRVGDVIWAGTNSIPNLGGTATFQPGAAIYDGANQINWHEATTGVAGSTAGVYGKTGAGVCPTGWRLPTGTEYMALYNASATGNISGYKGSWETKGLAKGLTLTTPGGSLFFPASGLNGGTHRDLRGYYTSSVHHPDEVSASVLNFYPTIIHPTIQMSKGNRYSVRCVKSAPAGAYTITATSTTGGSALVSPNKANADETITALATPDAGYKFTGWTLPGSVKSTDNPVNFKMPAYNATVHATFEPLPEAKDIKVNSSTDGDAVASPVKALAGEMVTVLASPAKDKVFKEWTVDGGVTVPQTNPATFKMGSSAVEITPVFKDALAPVGDYTIAFAGMTGGSAIAASTTANNEQSVTLLASAADGYKFKSWDIQSGTGTGASIANKEANPATLNVGSSDVVIEVAFDKKRDVKVISNNSSWGTANSSVPSAAPGESVGVMATPLPGYVFDKWGEPISSSDNPTSFEMGSAAVEVTAYFKEQTQPVVVVANNSNWGDPTFSPENPDEGETVTISPNPTSVGKHTGYTVLLGEITITNNTFVMPAGKLVSIRANYEPLPQKVLARSTIGGSFTINGESGDQTITPGTMVVLKAKPSANYGFPKWTVSGATPSSNDTDPTSFVMPENVVEVSMACEPVYWVNVDAHSGGTAVASKEKDIKFGEVVTFSAVPDKGYRFLKWDDPGYNELSTSNPWNVAMNSALSGTIYALFTPISYSYVDAYPSIPGAAEILFPEGEDGEEKRYLPGSTVTLQAKLNENYSYGGGWSSGRPGIPGVEFIDESETSASFIMPNEPSQPVEIRYEVEPIYYTISTQVTPADAPLSPYSVVVQPSSQTAPYGETRTFTATLNSLNRDVGSGTSTTPASYVFDSWTVKGGASTKSITSDSSYSKITLAYGSSDGTATANYKPRYRVTKINLDAGVLSLSGGTSSAAASSKPGITVGTSVSYTAGSIRAGYELISITAKTSNSNGQSITLSDSNPESGVLTFAMPAGNVVIDATTAKLYKITGEIYNHSVKYIEELPEVSGEYPQGTVVTLTAPEKPNHIFDSWTRPNISALSYATGYDGGINPTKVVMGNQDAKIYAIYKPKHDAVAYISGLYWSVDMGTALYKNAASKCASGWRLPTFEELKTLIQATKDEKNDNIYNGSSSTDSNQNTVLYSGSNLVITSNGGMKNALSIPAGTDTQRVWAETDDSNYAWVLGSVKDKQGRLLWTERGPSYHVRCVRK